MEIILADSDKHKILISVYKLEFWFLVGPGFSSPFTITTNRNLGFD